MYIDMDTHYWPLRMIERVSHPGKGSVTVKDGIATYVRDGKVVHSFADVRWDLDRRYGVMDREGFDLQVLIPDNRPLIYELDPELGVQLARAYNDTTAEDVKGHSRFIGIAWVYLPEVDKARAELRRSVTDLGMAGVKFMGLVNGMPLSDERLWPFYQECVDLDVPILVHPAAAIFDNAGANPMLVGGELASTDRTLTGNLGMPFTYMTIISTLIFGGVLDRFPSLKIGVFEGGSGWVPFLMDWLQNQVQRGHGDLPKTMTPGTKPVTPRPIRDYFSQVYVSAVSWETTLADVVGRWPDHKIMIGSDFDHGDAIATWPCTVGPVQGLDDLSNGNKEKILGGNAWEFFGFDRHPERLPQGRR